MQGNVDNSIIRPCGVCCDGEGRLYVADADNERLLLFDTNNGKVMQTFLEKRRMWIYYVCCTNDKSQLIILHGHTFDIYNILQK